MSTEGGHGPRRPHASLATTGGATIVAFLAPAGGDGAWMPVLARLGERGEVLWVRDVRGMGSAWRSLRLAALSRGETSLVWDSNLLVFEEDGTLRRQWRVESPTSLVLVDAAPVDGGLALVGRGQTGDGEGEGWVGVLGDDGVLRWQATVAGSVQRDYAGVVRSGHDGGLVFFGGTIDSTWVLRLPPDGRFDGECLELTAGEAVVVDGSATMESRTIDSVETSFEAADDAVRFEDDDLAGELVCAGG